MLDEQLIGEHGLALGHRIVEEIGRHALPVNPQNYEIWLAYHARSRPDLKGALDALRAAGREIADRDMQDIYKRFFTTTRLSTQVIESGSRIAQEIADALDALKAAGASTDAYGATLSTAAESLTSELIEGEAMKWLVAALSGATGEMSKQNAMLSARISRSSQEMETLRTSLRQARAEALTDALTGIGNRKLFDDTLRLRKHEADSAGTGLALIMADIDHFKAFNDTWGHPTGDQVIRFVASSLAKPALPDHLVARYGGEEFAVIMPRTRLDDAFRMAELMRRAIEAKRLVRRSTHEALGAVTASFGVAQYVPGETVAQLIARADECLYLSKRNGRNQVTKA